MYLKQRLENGCVQGMYVHITPSLLEDGASINRFIRCFSKYHFTSAQVHNVRVCDAYIKVNLQTKYTNHERYCENENGAR